MAGLVDERLDGAALALGEERGFLDDHSDRRPVDRRVEPTSESLGVAPSRIGERAEAEERAFDLADQRRPVRLVGGEMQLEPQERTAQLAQHGRFNPERSDLSVLGGVGDEMVQKGPEYGVEIARGHGYRLLRYRPELS